MRFQEATQEYKKALIEYNAALYDDLTVNRARYSAGFAHTRLGNFETAIDFLRKALNLDPDDPDHIKAWYMLGVAYKEKYLQISAKKKDLIEALEYFQKVVECNPENIDAWNEIGYTCGVLGEYAEALECYQKILELSPEYLFAWYRTGYIYKILGEYTKALECYQKTIELNPGYEMAWLGIGDVYKELGEYDKALESYKKVIDIDPRLEGSLRKKLNKLPEMKKLFDKGKEYFKQGKDKEALEQYILAVRLNPYRARIELGSVYLKLANFKKAVSQYKHVLRFNPKYVLAWYNMGFAYYNLDKKKKALECFQNTVELNPRFQKAWKLMGQIYKKIGNYDKAIECHEKALEIDPKN